MKRPELLMGGYRVVHCKRFRAMAIIVHDNSMKISSQASPLETLLSIGLMEPLDSHVSVGPSNGTGAAGSGNTGIVFADVETMEVKQNHLSNSSPQTKKVRVPWNKGKRHSPETIAKIKERTAMAMQTPQVRQKLRHHGIDQKFCRAETKVKISEKMKALWELKNVARLVQESFIKDWKEVIAEAARLGGVQDEELQWGSYNAIKQAFRKEELALIRDEKMRRKMEQKAAAKAQRHLTCSAEHRQKISDAIRAKWQDPEYRRKLTKSTRKSDHKSVQKSDLKNTQTGDYNNMATQVALKSRTSSISIDEKFVAEVLAEDHIPETRCSRSTSARINGHPRVILPRPTIKTSAYTTEKPATVEKRQPPVTEAKRVSSEQGMPWLDNSQVQEDARSRDSNVAQEADVLSQKSSLSDQEKLKLKWLKERWLLMEIYRREATNRARILMVEAERAVQALEAVAGTDKVALASLHEARQILAEAAHSIKRAESVSIDHPSFMEAANSRASSSTAYDASESGSPMDSQLLAGGAEVLGHGKFWTQQTGSIRCPHPIPLGAKSLTPKTNDNKNGSQSLEGYEISDSRMGENVSMLLLNRSSQQMEKREMSIPQNFEDRVQVQRLLRGDRTIAKKWYRGRLVIAGRDDRS